MIMMISANVPTFSGANPAGIAMFYLLLPYLLSDGTREQTGRFCTYALYNGHMIAENAPGRN